MALARSPDGAGAGRVSTNLALPDRDLMKAHPVMRDRWAILAGHLLAEGLKTMVWEVYRSDARQAFLFGYGRTAEELRAVGLDPALANPAEAKVTNAWTAKLSAHGWTRFDGSPAALAFDLVPLGADQKPWTKDDPWEEFVKVVARLATKSQLRHFTKPGKPPWDKPHVQAVEWSDALHRAIGLA